MTAVGAGSRTARRSLVAVRPDVDGVLWKDPRYEEGDLLVEWSSITKTVTARLLTRLGQAGEVDPALAVSTLFPQLPLDDVTLLDLARHRSGLPMMHPGASRGLIGDPCRGAGSEFVLERVGAAAVRGAGRQFLYSNLGYALLGLALENVTGRSWIDLVREWVLPVNAFPTVTISPEPSRQAVPRLVGIRRRPWSMSDGAYRAAGGLWSSFDDLVAYAEDALRQDSVSGWFVLRDGVRYHTGQARDTGVCVILDVERSRVGVAHAMLRSPNTAKRLLEKAMFDNEG